MMKTKWKSFAIYVFAFCLLCLLMLIITEKNVSASYVRYVAATSLNVREKARSTGKVVGAYKNGTKTTCYGTSGDWTKVKYNGKYAYVATRYMTTKAPVVTKTPVTPVAATTSYSRYVKANTLNIRSKALSTGTVIGYYKIGTKITCYGTSGSWTKVKYNGVYRYVASAYLSTTKPTTATTSSITTTTPAVPKATGTDVAKYALKFVGNPYVYGGTSLTNGADCSGYTMSVYKYFGYSIPRTSYNQRTAGTAVSAANRKVGDLICYEVQNGSGHVGIYIGNDQVVHSGSTKTGIHVSKWNYRPVNCVRRIVK